MWNFKDFPFQIRALYKVRMKERKGYGLIEIKGLKFWWREDWRVIKAVELEDNEVVLDHESNSFSREQTEASEELNTGWWRLWYIQARRKAIWDLDTIICKGLNGLRLRNEKEIRENKILEVRRSSKQTVYENLIQVLTENQDKMMIFLITF